MSKSNDATTRRWKEELDALYEGASEGILVVDLQSRRFVRASRAMCELLGYSREEFLALSVADIHPTDTLPQVLDAFDAMREGRQSFIRNIPCLRKNGSVVYTDVAAIHLMCRPQTLMIGFFRDVTEQNRTVELLRKSEQRYQLIADYVSDMIWTAPLTLSAEERAAAKSDIAGTVDKVLDRWRFSFVSPAAERLFGYAPQEVVDMSLRQFVAPESFAKIRDAIIAAFLRGVIEGGPQERQNPIEMLCLHKDGSVRWCEVVAAYIRDERGIPTGIMGITRDITKRRQAESALRESESKLRSLFENLPDIVLTVDRDANIQFANRNAFQVDGRLLQDANLLSFLATESVEACREAIAEAFASGMPRSIECRTVFGTWWSSRFVPLDGHGDTRLVMGICTDVTHERLATEAVDKEQRLLRQLLELHERERRLIAYEIHDGFAQQLTGALFRMQACREMQSRNPGQAAEDLDAATLLVSRAIDETRRLISGLRPPILDESGIVEAIEYLICEYGRHGGPVIEFTHHVDFERLPPPLENAVFRIIQESLQNACRHSRSERVAVALTQQGGRLGIDVRDWGIGFSSATVEEQRFGLQGIRERARLLNGHVVIESTPGKGTHIAVDLPFVDAGACLDNADRIGDEMRNADGRKSAEEPEKDG